MNFSPVIFRSRQGIALVTVLALMSLLIVLLLGLMSLATVDQSASSQGKSQAVARSNAKLAVVTAIGQLQQYAGPDQRVSALAEILEDPGAGSSIANPHWVGVWRADGLKNDPQTGATPLIHRSTTSSGGDAGSLIDRRDVGAYERDAEVLEWLVSRADLSSGAPDPTVALPPVGSVQLVGQGSVLDQKDHVRGERVAVDDGGVEQGGFAYWVGDEGMKARFNLSDAESGLGMEQPWMSPAQAGIGVLPGLEAYEQLQGATLSKVNSHRSLELSGAGQAGASVRTTRMDRFHDLGFHSAGLLVDTASGGLRRDLSAYFQNESIPALGTHAGVDDDDPILDSPKLRELSPRFGLLRHWNNLTTTGGGSANGVDPVAPEALANGTSWGWTSTQNYLGSGVNLSRNSKAPVHPVMVDVGVSYAVSLVDAGGQEVDGKKSYRFNIHYFPRVVLWNPYNVKINTANYVVHVNMPHKFNIKVDGIGRLYEQFETGYHDRVANLPHRPYFLIPGAEFEPGEALLFTADTGGDSQHWGEPGSSQSGSLSHFKLSCRKSAPFTDNFYVKTRMNGAYGPPIQLEVAKVKAGRYRYQVEARLDIVYKRYAYKLFLKKGGGDNVAGIDGNPSAFAPLQMIDQTENGATGTDALTMSPVAQSQLAPLKLLNTEPVVPYHRFKWGHRLQWVDELAENLSPEAVYSPPFTEYNTIANHNLRAGWHVRSPIEVAFRASSGSERYTHGIMIDDPNGWDWKDASLDPVPVQGKSRVSPFGRPASFDGQTFPLLDLPTQDAPLVSLGGIQHAPLSQFAWHPTYAFGNSLADPRVRRDRTTNYIGAGDWNLIGDANGGTDRWRPLRQGHANSSLDGQAFLYDLSYEANHALWDRYFLSTIDDTYTGGEELNNPRIVVEGSSGAPLSELKDYHRSASHLMVAGAFNVNSTSESAWEALLASFRDDAGMPITLADGSTIKGNDIYARLLRPYDSKYESDGIEDGEMWKGYRQLSDDQIREMAREIVVEAKRRGPFISLADFVNRRLVAPPSSSGAETPRTELGVKGTLQAAIDRTSINSTHQSLRPIAKQEYEMGGNSGEQQIKYGSKYPTLIPPNGASGKFGAKPDHNHWADSKLVGAPSYLTQADVLQKVGSVLSARSDTFVIRGYGDAVDSTGAVVAKAWCEAVVQRIQQPIEPDLEGIDPHPDPIAKPVAKFGRKFKVVAFRWLSEDEI